jgi:predicted nuclease of predicted toxin-antitoxin system
LKFKLDENLDVRLVAAMLEKGLNADTVLSEALSGASDDGILEVCKKTGRVLVTLDLDFANPFRFPPQSAPGILVLRPQRARVEIAVYGSGCTGIQNGYHGSPSAE